MIAGIQIGKGTQQPTTSNPSGTTPITLRAKPSSTAQSTATAKPSSTAKPTPSATPSAVPTLTPPQHGGGTSNQMAVGISPGSGFEEPFEKMSSSQQQAVINQMTNNGVQWLRLDYYPNSPFNYEFIKDAAIAGMNVNVILEDFSATPEEFASFATKAVTTFKPLGIHTYEILNEVNTHNTPTISAAQYALMLKAVYPAIKATDASATVLSSGFDVSGQPEEYLQAMYDAGGKGYFDAVSVHPYTFYPEMPAPMVCPDYSVFCHLTPIIHGIMQQNGDGNKKIWITEFGCPTGTNANQPAACTDETLAQQITQALKQANAWEWMGPFFVFNWQDNTLDGDFGLYYANGSPKPAALAAFMNHP